MLCANKVMYKMYVTLSCTFCTRQYAHGILSSNHLKQCSTNAKLCGALKGCDVVSFTDSCQDSAQETENQDCSSKTWAFPSSTSIYTDVLHLAALCIILTFNLPLSPGSQGLKACLMFCYNVFTLPEKLTPVYIPPSLLATSECEITALPFFIGSQHNSTDIPHFFPTQTFFTLDW